MNSKVKKMIDQSELVSFDIFDTLVNRMCKTPADVFALVAQQYELPAEQFQADRIQAEKAAREEDRLFLTAKGIDVSNLVFEMFFE